MGRKIFQPKTGPLKKRPQRRIRFFHKVGSRFWLISLTPQRQIYRSIFNLGSCSNSEVDCNDKAKLRIAQGLLGRKRPGSANEGLQSAPFIPGEHIPRPPPGGFAPWTPFAHPRGLRVHQGFGVNLSRGLLQSEEGRTPPNFPPSLAGKEARGLGQEEGPDARKFGHARLLGLAFFGVLVYILFSTLAPRVLNFGGGGAP